MVDVGERELVAGLQAMDIPMTHGDGFLEPGTYTVVAFTVPQEGEVQHEATNTA